MKSKILAVILSGGLLMPACVAVDQGEVEPVLLSKMLGFDISVTRDGVKLADNNLVTRAVEDSMASVSNMLATMDMSRPFSLIGIESDSHTLLIDNIAVTSGRTGKYEAYLEGGLLKIENPLLFSAYYPHVRSVTYEKSNEAYSIPYQLSEIGAGRLVSKTV